MSLKNRIQDDMKAAMRAQDKDRLAAIRLIMAAVKQREVDERITLDDVQVIAVLERMLKQRRESIVQFERAGREDLVAKETLELEIIQAYMPEALSEAEIEALIDSAIAATGAQSMRDMGRAMAYVKERAQGRADMSLVSTRLKSRLVG